VNPSTALARVLVDELVRGGVTEAVLSPGSRSAPLAFALHDADRAGRLRLHVRIDERSAAFLALGLAKESGRPVPVVTTSGTAAANLHPAVLEASHAHVPLLLLTADRPPELRGTGANQTVDQVKLYGDAVRLFVEVGAPSPGEEGYWRGLTCRALSAALGDLGTVPGPVHLNLALREPLVPDEGGELGGRPDGAPWTTRVRPRAVTVVDDLPARTVVVIGDAPAASTAAALRLAEARRWPVVAEPSASAGGADVVVDAAELVVGTAGWVESHRPDRVLVVGRPTLSRAVGWLVASCPSDVVAEVGAWSDAARRASRVLPGIPCATAGPGAVDPGWLPQWVAAGRRARTAVDEVLVELSEPVVAAEVMAAAPSLVVVGSSKPVRDLFLAGARNGVRVLANRGVAGIDGVVSTAVGAALAHGRPTYALLGDLTFLHDANGLVLGPSEPRPDLTLVVVNNDGGAIFGLLEQGGPAHAEAFERVFGTPHGVNLEALCRATGTAYQLVADREQLRAALGVTGGLRVVEVRTDRTAAVDLDHRLRAAVATALALP
jgi:2-succinyl-5-enolpyruvyl-6-hydroxy-3-cyclohexene-1-carboxylate synthase